MQRCSTGSSAQNEWTPRQLCVGGMGSHNGKVWLRRHGLLPLGVHADEQQDAMVPPPKAKQHDNNGAGPKQAGAKQADNNGAGPKQAGAKQAANNGAGPKQGVAKQAANNGTGPKQAGVKQAANNGAGVSAPAPRTAERSTP